MLFSRKPQIVSWNKGEVQTSPAMEWVAPTGKAYDRLKDFGGREHFVNDKLVSTLGGRAVRLEVITYPEGYHATRIVDAETGKLATEPHVAQRAYMSGPPHDQVPRIGKVLDHQPIPIGDGRIINKVEFVYTSDLSTNVTSDVPINSHEDLMSRSSVWITPGTKSLDMNAQGVAWNGPLAGSLAQFKMMADGKNFESHLQLQRGEGDDAGRLRINFNADGEVTGLRIARAATMLGGLKVPREVLSDCSAPLLAHVAPEYQAAVLNVSAQALFATETWPGIQVAESAQNMYAAMGQANFDPTTALVQKPS